jgi:CRISPR-associated endonuclease/helicase Cas3
VNWLSLSAHPVATPAPVILPVSDILFDFWALSTLRGKVPERPPV